MNLGSQTPKLVFPTDRAGQYVDRRETRQKSARVYLTFCKGRVHSDGGMPIFSSTEMRVLLWVKVTVAIALWTILLDALFP